MKSGASLLLLVVPMRTGPAPSAGNIVAMAMQPMTAATMRARAPRCSADIAVLLCMTRR